MGLIGDPVPAPWPCSQYLPWKRKYVFLKKNSKKYDNMMNGHGCSLVGFVSYSNMFLMIEMTLPTGTDINKAFISWEIIHPPS